MTKNLNRRRILGLAAIALSLPISSMTLGGHRHRLSCHRCGCCEGCQKVCRLVKEDKKVTVTCWGTKEEDFCLPGPSCPDCQHCESVCSNCQAAADASKDDKGEKKEKDEKVIAKAKKFVWTSWIPSNCGDVMTRKKLMKKTITKTIPGYKWVVEDLCPSCQADCESVEVPADAKIPTPPKVDGAKVIEPPKA